MEEEIVKPFVGKTFSLTGNMDRDSLIAQIKAAGGQISNTVHKRVSFLICTEEAMRRNTQRVRKALKLNVPIATPEFIADGISNRAIPDVALYKVTPATSTKAKPKAQDEPSDQEHKSSGDEAGKESNSNGKEAGEEAAPDTQGKRGKRRYSGSADGEVVVPGIIAEAKKSGKRE